MKGKTDARVLGPIAISGAAAGKRGSRQDSDACPPMLGPVPSAPLQLVLQRPHTVLHCVSTVPKRLAGVLGWPAGAERWAVAKLGLGRRRPGKKRLRSMLGRSQPSIATNEKGSGCLVSLPSPRPPRSPVAGAGLRERGRAKKRRKQGRQNRQPAYRIVARKLVSVSLATSEEPKRDRSKTASGRCRRS